MEPSNILNTAMNGKILIIEDNIELASLLAIHLRDQHYEVTLCHNGNEGLQLLGKHAYDLLVLDIMLPGVNGLDICKTLRRQNNYVPVLMLTAKSSELDRVMGLDIGADDYVTKPFSITEVLARIKAIFRRVEALRKTPANSNNDDLIERGAMTIDVNKHQVSVANKPIDLTAKEFDLLVFFARHPGRVYSRVELLDRVWGYGHDGYEHTVNSHINRLRVKIEPNPGEPHYILTVWGVGYKFSELH